MTVACPRLTKFPLLAKHEVGRTAEFAEQQEGNSMNTELVQLKDSYDYLAPDGSQIYLLAKGSKGGLCQCTLPVGATTRATSHKTVEEIWYFVEGKAEVWLKALNSEVRVAVSAGTSLVIRVNTTFQFRNTGDAPLKFLIATMPPWPGPSEATLETGTW